MFETSKDILYLALAVSVGLFTIFLVWLVAEMAIMMRHFNRLVREFREKLNTVEKAFSSIRNKVEASAGHLSILAEAVKQLLKFFVESRIKKTEGRKKK